MPTRRTFDKAEFLPNDNSTPHIVPGVLYPAIGGKLLDGTTSHSGDYGTSQSDSRKYYYTDIKGSRPIRDPRIGAHFGSQRHKFKSIQFLEQETATHGSNVYSVDGREWIRVTGANVRMDNDSGGHFLVTSDTGTASIVEITGYFNDINLLIETYNNNKIQYSVDGGTTRGGTLGDTTIPTPLATADGRYIDKSSVLNLDLPTLDSTTLGIHTIAIFRNTANDSPYFGVELIVQDTTNAVTRNKIQIPSQTVFSFGSKFTVGGSSAATHYDPFSAKSDGTGWTSPTSGTNNPNSSAAWPSNIDTATSLGLAKWVDGTNYYRPYNGGRVVNWVDENGEIKTSVTVMPPNAKSIADSGTLSNATAKSNGSAPNDNFRPTFEAHTSDIDEDLLSEVAKTYNWREFGNGSANGGSTGATYADASMLSGNDNIAYVMDDGLTSLSASGAQQNTISGKQSSLSWSGDQSSYLTFIGTGITTVGATNTTNQQTKKLCQNLPYGTHILKHTQGTDYAIIDGIALGQTSADAGHYYLEITFHQPKMPPIPEGACIIADYMFMADFVPVGAEGITVSKGVRRVQASRDLFYDCDQAINLNMDVNGISGFQVEATSGTGLAAGDFKGKLPAFGTQFVARGYGHNRRDIFVNGSDVSQTDSSTSNAHNQFNYPAAVALGVNTFESRNTGTGTGNIEAFEIVTPIHTSHHYKSFETPFLHELIGGDRNMEQTHLICSADGKTWDEVTRDTSYIGPISVMANEDTAVTGTGVVILKDWRGTEYTNRNYFNKDFAIAYDRVICLVDGFYNIVVKTAGQGGLHVAGNLYINGVQNLYSYPTDSGTNAHSELVILLKRGDYIQVYGKWNGDALYNNFMITRVR